MKWLSILPILVAVPSILATDFRSKITQIESLKSSPTRVESISELLKSNPYRQLLPENERNIPEPSYIIPSSSYVGQQFAALPTQATSRVPTNFDPFAIYTTKSTSKPLLSSKYDIPSNMTTLFSATLPPMVKITRQPTTGKNVIRMSKFNHGHDQGNSGPSSFDDTLQQVEYAALRSNAHISVPSHRLLNDILVIPSSRRLYVLAIIPIHESSGAQGFECGNVDVNAFLRLAAFLKSLDDVNTGSHLRESGLHIGAIVIDSCSSDLRTLADLYELFSGTNIDRSDIIAIIRDDKSYLPNIDEFANYLRIPTINTFFTVQEQVLTTGTLPTMEHPLQAILDLLKHTQSTCVSVVFDDLHAAIAKKLQQFTSEREMCLDEYLQIRGASSVETQQNVVRKLLLSEARIIIVLYGEKSWLDFLKALNNEMVISGRFVLVTLQDERWSTSRLYLDSWPHFDQLLISVTSKTVPNYSYLTELTNVFPKLPFPQQWLKQFWTMAFQCHIDGENIIGEQFSRPCPHQQNLNLSLISPDLNIAPISFAVHTVAVALRKISDHICPGALIHTLTDCLNDPYRSLFAAMLTAEFVHPLANERFKMNSTSGYTGTELVMNRVMYQHGVLSYEEIAIWDFEHGLIYTSGSELLVEERDGSRVKVVSKCPKSSCSSLTLMKYKISGQPSFKSGLNNLPTLVFSIIAILFTFVCLLCIYQQLVSGRDDPYYVCTILMFFGLSFLSIVSVFFIMTPSWITCAIRRTCFSVAVSFIFAPILVKTIMIWRDDVLLADDSHKKSHVSPVTMFCLCIVIVLIQFVIVTEWAFFDDPTQLEFAQFNDKFSWRCFPGTKFEHYILHSMALNVFLIVSSLLCSTITIKATASRQHVVISVMALVFGIALYIVLPMLNFIIRDQFFAVAILTYAILNVILSYCKGTFCDSNDSNENFVDRPIKMSDKSSMMSLDKRLFVQPSFFGQSINNSFSIPRENATMYSQKVPLSYRSSVASEYRMSNFV